MLRFPPESLVLVDLVLHRCCHGRQFRANLQTGFTLDGCMLRRPDTANLKPMLKQPMYPKHLQSRPRTESKLLMPNIRPE